MPFLLHTRNRPHEMTSSIKTDRKGGIFTTQTDSLCASCYLNNQMKSRERHSSLLCFLRRFGIWTWSLGNTKTQSSLEKIFERFLWFPCLFLSSSFALVLPVRLVAFVDIPALNCTTGRRWVWISAWKEPVKLHPWKRALNQPKMSYYQPQCKHLGGANVVCFTAKVFPIHVGVIGRYICLMLSTSHVSKSLLGVQYAQHKTECMCLSKVHWQHQERWLPLILMLRA